MKSLDQYLDELGPLESERAKLEREIIRAGGEPPKMEKREFSFSDPPSAGCISWADYKSAYQAHVEKLRGIATGKPAAAAAAPPPTAQIAPTNLSGIAADFFTGKITATEAVKLARAQGGNPSDLCIAVNARTKKNAKLAADLLTAKNTITALKSATADFEGRVAAGVAKLGIRGNLNQRRATDAPKTATELLLEARGVKSIEDLAQKQP